MSKPDPHPQSKLFGSPLADSSRWLISALTAVFHGVALMGITVVVDYLITTFFHRNLQARVAGFALASVVYAFLLLALFPIRDL